ncbi:hypothetical protein ACSCBZ_46815 [Streptomyces niveiscabiei]|uniref:hypothetical protein n=1 Tax=Streptomyces niveiscabiei TaxID=164115 RepID=UPI0006EBC741|nr:hypothetical protein [Streptomyces niveiscabiei]
MADKTPNHELRAVRDDELHMSRGEFARTIVDTGRAMGEEVGCTARLVAAWEDGDVGMPRPVYRRILRRVTGREMAELGFRRPRTSPVSPPGPGPADDGEEAGVERRMFMADGAGATAGAVLSLVSAGGRERGPGRIGADSVGTVKEAVAVIYAHDHDHGSAALRRRATEALHTAYGWLQDGAMTETTERRLRSAVGSLSIATGWLSYDSGRPADAQSLYGEALAAARIADDPELEAHAFGCLALLAHASGRPREAVAAAQGAQTAARRVGSPRLLSLMHMREARGWGLMGDATATDRAIVHAHHLYAQGPADADPPWLSFFAPGELAGLEALARADLGQHERAAAGAEQAVLLHGDRYARNRALYTADVAIQHAVRHRPDPEAAAEAAGRVLAYLPDVRSDRLTRSLHDVAGALQRHARVPEVAAWIEQYRSTTAT